MLCKLLFIAHSRAKAQATCAWFLKIALVRASVCVSVCPPPRVLITSGVIWCDIGRMQLVKQVSQLFHDIMNHDSGS